ncbi:glycosyltransferase family 2 protein [Curtobacterium ammoniigenes]|uniref:glycosyltransferase family 2 protein n=1 Tax=Curtobacterium ammoniigenes TaxID=395387 RepID=UPI0008367469|nr:glycosyltransferase family 2 protein [Curtobacterium ammoniigenes]
MTLAATLMVRDEADILPAWLDYHVAQGVDIFIITDNGSTDGTTDLLTAFATRDDVIVDLRHDPVHRKQQGQVVTQMARDAAVHHHADWVINADADEFLMPKQRSLTLRDVFAQLEQSVGAFTVPVVNMVGRMARTGTGIERLHWRDERSPEQLAAVGLLAQPSPNTIHVGDPDVTVAQGNHQASVAAGSPVPEELELEVLHLPWRSWQQYEHRVEIAGRAYEANPDLTPSPNHHGMRDYRRLHEGVLRAYFALRFVTDSDAKQGPFRRDDSLAAFFRAVESTPSTSPESLVPSGELATLVRFGQALIRRDALVADAAVARADAALWRGTADHERARADELLARVNDLERELHAQQQRRIVRMADRLGGIARRAARGR